MFTSVDIIKHVTSTATRRKFGLEPSSTGVTQEIKQFKEYARKHTIVHLSRNGLMVVNFPVKQKGLVSMVKLPAYFIIGKYKGVTQKLPSTSDYLFNVKSDLYVDPTHGDTKWGPRQAIAQQNYLTLVNEPDVGQQANTIAFWREDLQAIIYITARVIQPYEELTIHYGDLECPTYPRGAPPRVSLSVILEGCLYNTPWLS
jgi:hypothetical protein